MLFLTRAFALFAALLPLSGFGMKPPEKLCTLLLRAAVPPTQAQLDAYFAPATHHIYDQVSPELRQKLIRSSIALASYPNESGASMLAGEGYGTHGIAHLWLLGLDQQEIQSIVRPLQEEYWNLRIADALRLLKQGQDFRSPAEDNPSVTPQGGVTRIVNGKITGDDEGFAQALMTARDREQIDSSYGETIPAIVKSQFDSAMLAGDIEMAERLAYYMVLLDRSDTSTIYALEELGKQNELLALGSDLFIEALTLFHANSTDFHAIQNLEAALTALERVTDPLLKLTANNMLFQMATILSGVLVLDRLRSTGISADRLEDSLYGFYDLALDALSAMGEIVERKYADSVRVELIFKNSNPTPSMTALLERITHSHLQLQRRVSDSHFESLRNALQSFGRKDLLTRCGQSLFERRATWRDAWAPTEVYGAAFEFFMAANDLTSAREVLAKLTTEFKFVEKFDRNNRKTIDKEQLLSIVEMAVRAQDGTQVNFLVGLAEVRGWKDIVDKSAVLQSGDSFGEPEYFPHTVEIPQGLSYALQDPFDIEVRVRHARRQPQRSAYEGHEALNHGEIETAQSIFMSLRDADGMEAVGDAYMRLYDEEPMRHYQAGSSAHRAYIAAATFAAEP